jgi:nitroimidazol reductase NimA-like FMN-containing flavoprotein (pyridoxamine 5'-phosphate oxidase superfamily)
VRETAAELARLQDLLDASYAGGGSHLLRIHTPERRLDAEGIAARLEGMVLLALATVSAAGKPVVGPVDGVFLHGSFHFGSAPDSARARHIARRPDVSATHLPGEELAVTVHGRALPVDVNAPEGAELREALLEIYVPRYGEDWAEMLESGAVYWRIEAERIFAFHMPPEDVG